MRCPCCEGQKRCPLCHDSGVIDEREVTAPFAPPAAGARSPVNMTVDEFRAFALQTIDDALGHSWLVRGDSRKLLQALRTYLPAAPAAEVERVMAGFPR